MVDLSRMNDPEYLTELKDQERPYRFNITLEELEQAVEYAKKHGVSEFNTITMHISPSSGIINVIEISSEYNTEKTNITNYGAA